MSKVKYVNKLAYNVASGDWGVIREYNYNETPTGIKENWTVKVNRRKDFFTTDVKPLILDSLKFSTVDNTITAVVKLKGRTLVGTAILSPHDKNFTGFGRKLALARALKNEAVINECLDRDFNADYWEEYSDSNTGADAKAAEDSNE